MINYNPAHLIANCYSNSNLCQIHTDIEQEVVDFMAHVKGVGEESITDFLLWRWAKANNNFKHFNVKTFTKAQENTISGADFELKLWVLTKFGSFSMAFQAKKISKPFNGYHSKINYKSKNAKHKQIDVLLNYAKSSTYPVIPMYCFYSKSDSINHHLGGVFATSAGYIKYLSNEPKSTRISRSQLLGPHYPFHAFFCTHHILKDQMEIENFEAYKNFLVPSEDLPPYIEAILEEHESSALMKDYLEKYKLSQFKHIGVLDIRNEEGVSPLFVDFVFQTNFDLNLI